MSQSSKKTESVAHEALCTNCGKCCYKKIIVGRTVYITPFPCEFLDTHTNLCTIYDKREELNPLCLSVEQGLKVNAFPEDCPYVPELAPKNYRPARDDWNWKDEWDDFDNLADDLDVKAEVREIVRARGPEAPPMHVEAFARILAQREKDKQAPAALQNELRIVDARNVAPEKTAAAAPSLAGLARQRSRRDAAVERLEKHLKAPGKDARR